MKKLIALFLCLLSCFCFSLVGCGAEQDASGSSSSTQEENSGSSSSEQEESVDFFAIVGEITGKTVTTDTVPYYFTIGSDGSYCTIDTNPLDLDDFSSSTALNYIKQMNTKLELPEYVYQEMITTSYSQGKQTATVGEISVTWYYHPDKGLNATYKKLVN